MHTAMATFSTGGVEKIDNTTQIATNLLRPDPIGNAYPLSTLRFRLQTLSINRQVPSRAR
jgi:hypothetical protein